MAVHPTSLVSIVTGSPSPKDYLHSNRSMPRTFGLIGKRRRESHLRCTWVLVMRVVAVPVTAPLAGSATDACPSAGGPHGTKRLSTAEGMNLDPSRSYPIQWCRYGMISPAGDSKGRARCSTGRRCKGLPPTTEVTSASTRAALGRGLSESEFGAVDNGIGQRVRP